MMVPPFYDWFPLFQMFPLSEATFPTSPFKVFWCIPKWSARISVYRCILGTFIRVYLLKPAPSVHPKSFIFIFLIFASSIPDFREENVRAQIWAKWPVFGVFRVFSRLDYAGSGGWSYRLTHVCPSFVCLEFFSKTGHRIFLKLGMKLKDNSGHNLTKPDFPGKIWFVQKLPKCVKNEFDFSWKPWSFILSFYCCHGGRIIHTIDT